MSIISIVMIFAFVSIYIITYSNVNAENKRKIDMLMPLPENIPTLPSGDGKAARVIINNSVDSSHFFSILVNPDGEIVNINSQIDFHEKVYNQAAKTAWSEPNDNKTISIDNRQWLYKVSMLQSKLVIRNNFGQQVLDSGCGQITFLDVTESIKTLTDLFTTFVFVSILMIVIIFFISLYFANRSIKPISETWEKQKQFVTDASHELKTPLAFINANTDALLANEDETIKSQRKWIDHIQDEISRMAKLVNDLLYLSKTENAKAEISTFDMSEMVKDIVLSIEAVIYEKGISLSYKVEPRIVVKGDKEKIKRVIMILVENAIKYTNKNGSISILLIEKKNRGVFTIINTGKGISEKDLPNIFDRFYRADKAREHDSNSYGLGLSIAKAIADCMGGKISAFSTENANTTFTFEVNRD